MAAPLVLDRIAAWEQAGLIDHDLAERLRAAETAQPSPPPAPTSAVAEVATPPRGRTPGFVVEFFAYLGASFLLLAWYAWFQSELPEETRARNLAVGFAALVPALLLFVAGWLLAARREERLRRAAGVALVAAVPNAGVATWALLQAAGMEPYGGPLTVVAGAAVALGIAAAGRVRRPAALTQGALLAAWAALAIALSQWAQEAIWPAAATDGGGSYPTPDEERLRYVVRLGWWWLVAAAPATALVLRPDRGPGHESRDAVTRAGVGVIAVLGSASSALATYGWPSPLEGEPVFGPWVGAAIMLGVGGVFVLAARQRGSRIHLVTAGAAIVIALSYLNAEYVVDSVGAPAALLVEGLMLLGVAASGWAAGRLISRRGAPPAT